MIDRHNSLSPVSHNNS